MPAPSCQCVLSKPHDLFAAIIRHGPLILCGCFFLFPMTTIGQSTNACPALATLSNKAGWEAGAATYTARQEGDDVFVSATGANPTAAFKTQLAREPEKIFPPRLALYRKPPDGIAAQVITPFTVCATFKASRRVSAVTVRDSKGEHRVPVESPR
jgi:hypothetical protein